VPHIDMNRVTRRRALAPQLTGRKLHGIEVLRFLALQVSVGVWEKKDAAIQNDHAAFSSHIAREARVPGRVYVARANFLAGFESRSNRDITSRGTAVSDGRSSRLDRE